MKNVKIQVFSLVGDNVVQGHGHKGQGQGHRCQGQRSSQGQRSEVKIVGQTHLVKVTKIKGQGRGSMSWVNVKVFVRFF